MTTTRARAGRSWVEPASSRRTVEPSVVTYGVLQQGREPTGGEAEHRLVEPFLSPRREVELDLAGCRLDRTPERPAVCRHQRLQADPGEEVPDRTPEVGRHELLDLGVVEVALGAGVAQLEARVVVAGVLVVDDPDLAPVVEEVAGQQVVVAGHGGTCVDGQRGAGAVERGIVVDVAVEERVPVLPDRPQVAALPGEHVEFSAEARSLV